MQIVTFAAQVSCHLTTPLVLKLLSKPWTDFRLAWKDWKFNWSGRRTPVDHINYPISTCRTRCASFRLGLGKHQRDTCNLIKTSATRAKCTLHEMTSLLIICSLFQMKPLNFGAENSNVLAWQHARTNLCTHFTQHRRPKPNHIATHTVDSSIFSIATSTPPYNHCNNECECMFVCESERYAIWMNANADRAFRKRFYTLAFSPGHLQLQSVIKRTQLRNHAVRNHLHI